MCSRIFYLILLLLAISSCYSGRKLQGVRSGDVSMLLAISDEEPLDEEELHFDISSVKEDDEPYIMNAVKDEETGEMVASDVINSSKIVARFRNVPERAGYVSISFDVVVPSAMSDSRWQLKLYPSMLIQEDTLQLDPVFITGKEYRAQQLRGYQRYRNFLSSIITDTTDFIRMGQLEVFIERNFPQTFAMKSDTSVISDPVAGNLFGVTQYDALIHYTRHIKKQINQRRKSRVGEMYDKYVTDPILKDGIRLDTVFVDTTGEFIYRYEHSFRSRPFLKKVIIGLRGDVYERGECICSLPLSDELTFYISSLSTMADLRPRYKTAITERVVHENLNAMIDFKAGSAVVDTSSMRNRSEFNKVRHCMSDLLAQNEFGLDSLVVTASCSPEGSYKYNQRLSLARSRAVSNMMSVEMPEIWKDRVHTSCMPENWEMLLSLVAKDSILTDPEKIRILNIVEESGEPDMIEKILSQQTRYSYLKEKIYPELRTVTFSFHLHRLNMERDTVYTAEPDVDYMAGVDALRNLDYMSAIAVLKPYSDYNAALAYASADCNHSALDILEHLSLSDARTCYLKALVLSRLGRYDEARDCFDLSVRYDPQMLHRANLDPEMYKITNRRIIN